MPLRILLKICLIFTLFSFNIYFYQKSLKIPVISNDIKLKEKEKLLFNNNIKEDLIEIANYDRINPEDKDYFYIPIIGSNDIHGHFYPEDLKIESISYTRGGLDYLAKYINIIRKEFNNNVLYLDAGDMFRGGIESTKSNGEIILDYFNLIKVDGVTLGNNELNEKKNSLEQKIKKAKFPFIVSNIFDSNKKTKKLFDDNLFTSKVYTFNVLNSNISIGVIGFTLNIGKNILERNGYKDIKFLDYKNAFIVEANKLKKEQKVNAIVLFGHLDILCGKGDNLELNIYKPSDIQEDCDKTSVLYKLLNSVDEGLIDAIISGHNHQENHCFVNNIPIISSINNGLYSNIIYLAFDRKNNYKIAKDKIRIEGPLPICEKIFKKSHNCQLIKGNNIEQFLPLVNYKFHGELIEQEPLLQPIHDKYDELYRKEK